MGLRFTGRKVLIAGTSMYSLEAFDVSSGGRVKVRASLEALQDYGDDAVEQKAIDKYDAAQFDGDWITVTTTDFN